MKYKLRPCLNTLEHHAIIIDWYAAFESMCPTSYPERHINLQKNYPELYEEDGEEDGL